MTLLFHQECAYVPAILNNVYLKILNILQKLGIYLKLKITILKVALWSYGICYIRREKDKRSQSRGEHLLHRRYGSTQPLSLSGNNRYV